MTSSSQRRIYEADEVASAEVTGAITSVKAGIVSGWVDSAERGRLLALFVGRRRLATTRQLAGGDSGAAIFAFDAKGCPPDLLARSTLAIDVAVLGAQGSFASVEVASESFLAIADLAAAQRARPLEGCIDQQMDGLLRGWAHDRARPERRLELFVFTGARYLGKYVADRPRPDLAATGHGDGAYGFEIPIAAEVEAVTVVAGEPEYWRIPPGRHALVKARRDRAQEREALGSLQAFARALTTTEPFPKRAFVLDKLEKGSVPDAFSPDYLVLALECLRHEMAASGEAMGGGWRSRLRTWAAMRVTGARMRRLEELATAIAAGSRLVEAAGKRRSAGNGPG